jgi:hypothetical protein
MSFRIEHADPLALLGELPDSWAQTCFTNPPRDLPVPYLLAVLDEVYRVLRPDGTLWLALTRGGNTQEIWRAVQDTPWLRPLPATTTPRRMLLLAKQPEFLFKPKRPAPSIVTQPTVQQPGRGCHACRVPRRAWCVPSPAAAGVPAREVIDWCLSASTVPCACEVCGAPCRPLALCGERWRSACAHKGGRGRCLVIDPFCATAEVGIVAVRRGRHYLGINPDPAGAEAARCRLTRLLERTR